MAISFSELSYNQNSGTMYGGERVFLGPDIGRGTVFSKQLNTVSGSPFIVEVPESSKGFRLFSAGSPCYFALNEDPETTTSVSGSGPLAVGSLDKGNVALANNYEVRLMEPGYDRQLRILGPSSGSITVEFF